MYYENKGKTIGLLEELVEALNEVEEIINGWGDYLEARSQEELKEAA